jgi:hypothetical protein
VGSAALFAAVSGTTVSGATLGVGAVGCAVGHFICFIYITNKKRVVLKHFSSGVFYFTIVFIFIHI